MSGDSKISPKIFFSNPFAKAILFLLAAAVSFLLIFAWQYHIKDATKEFEKPKLLNLRIEDEIFIKGMEWKEYRLMENSMALLTCEIVRTPGMTVSYRMRYRNFDETKPGCEWR
ncbi:MAG: hypothetical protein FJ088_13185, partial [Deltaproteobacteria bacterium]|nr:hypothetical protein [Deltaproteobacteria bacterium]